MYGLYTRGIFIAYQKRKKNPVSEMTRVNESIQQIKMIASNRLTSSPRLEIRENLKDYLYLKSPHYFPEYALGVEMKKSDSNWATPKRPSLFVFSQWWCATKVYSDKDRAESCWGHCCEIFIYSLGPHFILFHSSYLQGRSISENLGIELSYNRAKH